LGAHETLRASPVLHNSIKSETSSFLASLLESSNLETQRGKEPTWESHELPYRNAVTIPRHGSRALKKGTAARILYQLELDLDELEEKYAET